MKRTNLCLLVCSLLAIGLFNQSCKQDDACPGIDCNSGSINESTCTCDCPPGFSGTNCEVEDLCVTQSIICQNGGACIDGVCACPDGFSGPNCEVFDAARVQYLLDFQFRTPMELFLGGVPLDSLYGKKYEGGLIFFLDTESRTYPFFDGQGMVLAEQDYSAAWGCHGVATGATSTEVGRGQANTSILVHADCGNDPPLSALLADTLIIEGYKDWFLPSIEEMNLVYENLYLNGHSDFSGSDQEYQSSTEVDADQFMLRLFWRNGTAPASKNSGGSIRPVRIF